MSKKRKFPENFVLLSKEKQIENIEYLLEHYKEYKVKIIADNHIQIGNQVDIWRFYFTSIPAHAVNHARYIEKDKRNQLATKLFDCCAQEAQKRKKIQEEIINGISLYVLCGAVVAFIVLNSLSDRKTKKIDKAVEQYEQSLPNYDEYKQTQEKIANYRDSLTHAVR